jgi:hypothetical protein
MKNPLIKFVVLVSIFTILVLYGITPTKATNQNDPLDDVWDKNSITQGDFVDPIDLEQVELQGSSILISTDGDLSTLATDVLAYFLILLSDDGDPTTFEASIIYSQIGTGEKIIYWTLSDPLADSGVEWECSYSFTSVKLTTDGLEINFVEFDNIVCSEVLVISLAKDTSNEFFDWIGYYLHSYIQEIYPKLISNLAVTLKPSSTTTTKPATTQPTIPTTTPTTSIIPTTTAVNTSPIIIPTTSLPENSTTTTKDETGSTVSTSTEEGDSITPGYTLMGILLAIPSLVLLNRFLKSKKV